MPDAVDTGTILAPPESVRPLLIAALLFVFPAPAPAAQHVILRGNDAYGKWFNLSSVRGRPVVITFASRYTEKDARAIGRSLDPYTKRGVLLVTVIDMRGIPGFAHGYAMKKIRSSQLPGHVHIVDEKGQISRGFGVDPRHHVDTFVVGANGRLLGHYVGRQELSKATAQIDEAARSTTPRAARRATRR